MSDRPGAEVTSKEGIGGAQTVGRDSLELQSEKRPLKYDKDEPPPLRFAGEVSGVRKLGRGLSWAGE